MGANSRNKGSAFERDVARQLEALTGVSFKRDLEQYRAADHGDLIPNDPAWPFVVECKRYQKGTGCKPAWIAQAAKAAKALGKFPAVVFKFDRLDARVSVPFAAIAEAVGGSDNSDEWANISVNGFAHLASELMAGRK